VRVLGVFEVGQIIYFDISFAGFQQLSRDRYVLNGGKSL